ncbi:unnamed protein product [Protopolystoma xenopodis]|uniref:Uncharacterized protein n=1 Tax=Protopolystoma xenopodis TaxID=117903 RepID=A0A3S5BWH6_9PLAT|nr:unnamed protein product [Protopolystoma xenopodis]
MVLRMSRLNDDADYDPGETSGNVLRPRSYSGNDNAYNGLRTRCVFLSLPTNVTKLENKVKQLVSTKGDCDHTKGHTILVFIPSTKPNVSLLQECRIVRSGLTSLSQLGLVVRATHLVRCPLS